jgi:hypothetical protein
MKPLYNALEDALSPASIERTARRIAVLVAVFICISQQAYHWFRRAAELTYKAGYCTGQFVHALNHAWTQLAVHRDLAPAVELVVPVVRVSKLCLQDCVTGAELVYQCINDKSEWEQWKQILLQQLQYLHKTLIPSVQFA